MTKGSVSQKIVQRNKKELANAYPSWYRKIEWISLFLFAFLAVILFYKIVIHFSEIYHLVLPAFFLGWIAADVASGLVHWGCDTWGKADTWLVGPALIRPFREHHVDAKAMTKHDFIETNGSSALIGVPILLVANIFPFQSSHHFLIFLDLFVFFLTFFVFLTNQIHKWSHMDHIPVWVKFLQKSHIILDPKHHGIHHAPPFSKYYCITTGWTNKLLYRIQLFPFLEKMITKFTGAIPREDDIGTDAAVSLVEVKNE